MLYFNCDYMAGAHPDVLQALCDTNLLKTVGYGDDQFTSEAKQIILEACGLEDGALLAKGRLLALQFMALFTDNLYLKIGLHADKLAMKMREGFSKKGYHTYIDSHTNQQFFKLPNHLIDTLSKKVGFELWGPRGEQESIVRFVTDWSTTEKDIDTLLNLL